MTLLQRIALYGLIGLAAAAAIVELPHTKHFSQSSLVATVDVPTMAQQADLIVTGTVTKRLGTTRLADATGEDMVYTRWQITPDRTLKGQGKMPVVVWVAGGRYLTTSVDVEDQPTFAAGQQVLLFLQSAADFRGGYRTVGEFQGKFTLTGTGSEIIAIQDSTGDRQSQTAIESTIEHNLEPKPVQ